MKKIYILFTLNQEGGGLTHFLNNFKENWKPLGILRNSQFSSVQFSRLVMCNSLRPHGLQHARLLCPSPTREAYSNSVMPSNHLILCHPFSSCLQSFPAAGSFAMSRLCIKWPKYWSFSISTFSEYSGLISFRIDWIDLLAVQETLKSLLQHHN